MHEIDGENLNYTGSHTSVDERGTDDSWVQDIETTSMWITNTRPLSFVV